MLPVVKARDGLLRNKEDPMSIENLLGSEKSKYSLLMDIQKSLLEVMAGSTDYEKSHELCKNLPKLLENPFGNIGRIIGMYGESILTKDARAIEQYARLINNQLTENGVFAIRMRYAKHVSRIDPACIIEAAPEYLSETIEEFASSKYRRLEGTESRVRDIALGAMAYFGATEKTLRQFAIKYSRIRQTSQS
jgi:hypothetical protein